MKLLSRIDVLFALPILVAGFWVAVPSSWFVDPVAVYYDGREVTLIRRTPHGPMYATWSREMHVVGTDRECHAEDVTSYMRQVDGQVASDGKRVGEDTVRYTVGAWALPCLRSEPPIIVTHSWQARFLGIFPLRPVRQVVTIERRLEA